MNPKKKVTFTVILSLLSCFFLFLSVQGLWFDGAWGQKQNSTTTKIVGSGLDFFPICWNNCSWNHKALVGQYGASNTGADILFLNVSENVVSQHELETEWNQENSSVWVAINLTAGTGTQQWFVYFNNSQASSISNPD